MANYRSRPQSFNRVTSSIDEDRMNKSMDIIDAKTNANTSKVYQAIQQVASIDLLREPDQKHLHDNLKSVLDMIDGTDNIDFSKGNVGGELQGYIASAIDKQTLKHAGIAAKYKNFESELAKKKEKNDGTYNEGNRQDALKQAGFYDYMKGEADSVNSLSYTNYVDVQDKMLKTVKQLKDLHPNKPIEIFDPTTGITTKKSVSTLSRAEWQRHINNSFDDNDKAQLAINGRQAYNYDDTEAVAVITEKKKSLEESYDKEIERLTAMKTTTSSSKNKKYYQDQIDAQTRAKKAALTTLDTIPKTAGQIGAFLTQEHLSSDMAKTMSKETILSKKIDYKMLNEKAKYLEKIREKEDQANGLNSGITTKAQPVDSEELNGKKQIDLFNSAKETSINSTRELLKSNYEKLKKNSAEVVEQIDKVEKTIISEYKEKFGRNPQEFELHRLVLDKVEHLLPADMKPALNKSLMDTNSYFKAEEEAKIKTINNEIAKNSANLYEQTYGVTNNFQMFDKAGQQVSVRTFFKENEIKSKKDLADFLARDTENAKVYKANVMLQSINETKRHSPVFNYPGTVSPFETRVATKKELKGVDLTKYEYAESILGENTDLISERSHLEKIKGRRITDTDRVISNEGSFSTLLDEDDFQKEYEKSLKLSSANIAGMNAMTISSQSGLHKELIAATDNTSFKEKRPISLIDNGDTITMYQTQEVEKEKYDRLGEHSVEKVMAYITETINKNDLSPNNYSELYKQLSDQKEKAQITFFKEQDFEKDNLSFYENNATQGQGLRNLFGNNLDIIAQASKGDVIGNIRNTLDRNLRGKQGSDKFYKIAETVVDQIDKFKVSMETTEDGGYSQIQIKMQNKEGTEKEPKYDVLYTMPVRETNEQMNKILHGAPQVMVVKLLIEAGKQVGQGNITLANKFAKNLD